MERASDVSRARGATVENVVTEWSVDSHAFMRDSGREDSRNFEICRRARNAEYSASLKGFHGTLRCADHAEFAKYTRARLSSLRILATESFAAERRNHRWKAQRALHSYLARLCDRLFDRTSTLYGRQARSSAASMSTQERAELRRKLKETMLRRKERGKAKTVVFFGDGTFSAGGRGHASTPKKKILTLLCTRGSTVLLDEYRTSKICPCGLRLDDDRQTTKAHNASKGRIRLRCHKTTGSTESSPVFTSCSVLDALYERGLPADRDILAVINMLKCGLSALQGCARPVHLCRENTRR